MDYKDLLDGRPLNWETIGQLQRDVRYSEKNAQTRNLDYIDAVKDACRVLDEQADPRCRKIPAARSEVMKRLEDSHLSVDFLTKKMHDKRYSGERWERDAEYIKAIEDGFKELCSAK